MKQVVTIVLAFLVTATAVGQVPAGVPFDPKTHPNPVITWVRNQDFKASTFSEAAQSAGVELMTLSQDEGRRELIEIALPVQGRQRVRIVDEEAEVTFYPVARQTYKLKSGKTFVICSFRFPRVAISAEALNMAAFGRPRRPADARFGTTPVPDRIDIRGHPGLLFSDADRTIVYWFELGAGMTVTMDSSKEELFKVLEDLL